MTSLFGALWTVLQSLGWMLYFIHQLMSDALNVNYRLVSAVGHLIAGIAKLLYTLSTSLSLAAYEGVSCVLLKVVGIFTFAINSVYFVVYCCTLLFKLIYFTVTGIADGLAFVLLTPLRACQTIHSWIFNPDRWLNALAWCFSTCAVGFSLVGEAAWQLIAYSVITLSDLISSGAALMYECIVMSWFTVYDGLLALCAGVSGGITLILSRLWSLTLMELDLLCIYVLGTLVNSVCNLWQLCADNYLCFIPISLSPLVLLLFRGSRLARFLTSYFRRPRNEVIRIHLNDLNDMIDVSDDERDDLPHNAARNMFDYFPIGNQNEDIDVDSDEEESNVADTTDENTDDSDIGTDSDAVDSDQETIDVQLPDQPTTSASSRQQHGYATRSKGNAVECQRRLDHERERSLCVICQDQVKSVLVLPCRHMCMCVDCARTVVSGTHNQRRICPLCRGDIRVVMNVYT